ncbi:MAG: DUF4493 domain-containing protein [Ekhidna sp.]|nr:DUF4493 domain-containing protein [Ekhidna sp.]
MKSFINKNLPFLFVLTFLFGCTDEDKEQLTDPTKTSISISISNGAESTRGRTEEVTLADFEVRLLDATDDSEVEFFADASQIPASFEIEPGTYYITAEATGEEAVGFDMPSYFGRSENVSVSSGNTAEISVTVSLTNVKVSVNYSSVVQESFDSYTTTVSSGGDDLVFTEDETRSGFFPAGVELSLLIDVDGLTATNSVPSPAARDHYIVNVDFRAGSIVFDLDSTITEPTYDLPDGLYLQDAAGSINENHRLLSELVSAPDFMSMEREGFYQGLFYIDQGAYSLVELQDGEIANLYGGSPSVTEGRNPECDGSSSYQLIDAQTGGSRFSVNATSIYVMSFDETLSEIIYDELTTVSLIGGATDPGWGGDTEFNPVALSSEGGSWTVSEVNLREGQWKIRSNCRWEIDRRIDPAGELDNSNGYVFFTNLGSSDGTPQNLVLGGPNIENSVDGVYTINLDWNPTTGFSAETIRTGDIEEEPIPDVYTWGIIGSATQPDGWSNDKKLTYVGQLDGVYTWRGVFPLAGGTGDNAFKFRTDETWAIKLTPTDANVTLNTEDGTISDDGATNSDGQWFVADGRSGLYYFEINTSDNAETWNIIIDEATFEIIGEATPGGWDTGTEMTYNDDLASATVSGLSLTDGGYKFRVNQSWDYNLGGSLTELVFDGSNLTATAGIYDITIGTADGGVTYTAVVE